MAKAPGAAASVDGYGVWPAWARLVQQTVKAILPKAPTPFAHPTFHGCPIFVHHLYSSMLTTDMSLKKNQAA